VTPPPRRDRGETGKAGEEQAARELASAGWTVVGRNWRTRFGEIDIIALDGEAIVFVEVKTWPHGADDDLAIAIGPRKRKRMADTAKCFLDTHRQYNGMYVRFDVILASSQSKEDGSYRFRHLRDAFSEREE
jgi:putative endonuclease